MSERGRTMPWGEEYLPTNVLSACSFAYGGSP